jgi:hypothetical protein
MPAGWGLVVRGPFAVQGWVVDTSAPPVAVIVTLAGRGAAIGHLGFSRPAEAERYPELDEVGSSGWVADLDLADAPLGMTEVAAWLGRANGELVQIGRAPIRILGGIEALPPEVQRGGSTPAASDGTISSARDIDERWIPPRVSLRVSGTTSSPGPGLQVGRRATTEIHVPISPTPGFFLRVHYLAASLRRFSNVCRDLKLVITVGDDVASDDLYALNPWSRHYPLEWRWLDPARFRAYSYFATAAERLRYEFAGEVVLLMDADTLVVGPLAELVDEAAREPALYGVMSSLSPAWTMARTTFGAFWPALYAGAGLPPPRLICEPYGWGVRNGPQARDPDARQMPPYFNLGFLCGPRTIMQRIGDGIYDGMAAVDRFHQTAFRAQLGLTLTLERHHIPWRTLGLRYNFSNMQPLADAFPADVDDLRVIQYHAGDDFIRDVDFGSIDGVSWLLRRTDLLPINARLRDALAEIHDTVRAERAE